MPELDKFYSTWEKVLLDNFFILMEKFNLDLGAYIDSYNLLTMIILFLIGVLLNYAGLKVHKILMPSVIGLIGGFFTAMIVSSVNQSEMTILISTIIAGVIFAVLSIVLLRLSFLLLGVIFGLGLVATAGYNQIEVFVLVGILFGIIAWFLYNFTIIILTCFSGSVLLTFAILNSYVLIRSHSMQIYAKSFSLYAKEMITPFLRPSFFPTVFSTHKIDYILLFVLLLTGFTFQYGLKLLPVLGKKKVKSAVKPTKKSIVTEIKKND